jgi:hypothetical protein
MAKNQKPFSPAFGFQKISPRAKMAMAKYNQRVRGFKRGFPPFPYWMNPIIIDRSGIAAGIGRHPYKPGWNGYILLPKNHKYSSTKAGMPPYEVHGGITYLSFIGDYRIIGWDCGHINSWVFYSERGKELSIKETLYLYEQAKRDMLPLWKRFFNWIK